MSLLEGVSRPLLLDAAPVGREPLAAAPEVNRLRCSLSLRDGRGKAPSLNLLLNCWREVDGTASLEQGGKKRL